MKIVKPSIEIMRTGLEMEFITPEKHIERVGRTCYKSEDKITDESAAKFVSGLIKRGHEAMIEHYSLIFQTESNWYEQIVEDWELLLHSGCAQLKENLRPFLRFTDYPAHDGEIRYIISGNMRAWRDYAKACYSGFGFIPAYLVSMIRNFPLFFPEFQDYVPAVFVNDILIPTYVRDLTYEECRVHQDVTIKFICDRGVSHEIVRHRTASFAQESTRYCNYSLDKFRNEIAVIEPSWCDQEDPRFEKWMASCIEAQDNYFDLLNMGCTPQEARSVLPNSLKTEVIMTGNLDCWSHFFELRCAPDAHPDIQVVAKMAYREIGLMIVPHTKE